MTKEQIQFTTDNKEYLIYLFDLQESGRTNMFGAGSYLQSEMGLDRNKAKEVTLFWLQNHGEIANLLEVEV